MTRTQKAPLNESLERRLDTMHMSASDIARAKASLRNADLIVDFGFGLAAAVRASAAFAARQLKAAFVSSPQH